MIKDSLVCNYKIIPTKENNLVTNENTMWHVTFFLKKKNEMNELANTMGF